MKRKFLVLFFIFALMLVGCDGLQPPPNFSNEDIVEVVGKEGYYTDESLAFCTEIRGSYKSNRPFNLDENNENLRIWDDLYLYEYDYFQMIASGTSYIYYTVNDEDMEFVDIYPNLGEAVIKPEKSGVYKITFDLTTKKFDLEFKSEITTPVYEEMDGCDIYSLKNGFVPLVVNPNNEQELMISNYAIDADTAISFYNHGNVHLSNYKVILDESAQGRYATSLEDGDKHIDFSVGGVYNIYVNPTTYRVRVELTNPDTATYSLQVYEGVDDIIPLSPVSVDTPYIYHYTVARNKNASLPIMISEGYNMYTLSVNPSAYFDADYECFNTAGNYLLEINLKEFAVTVTYLPQ